jgi:hypothetical protein
MTPESSREEDGRQFPPAAEAPPAQPQTSGPEEQPDVKPDGEPAVDETRLGRSLRTLAEAAVEFGVVVGEESAKTARHVGGIVLDRARKGLVHGLEWASATPEERRGFIHKVVEVVPLVGAQAHYAMAWKRWHAAKAINDETMMQSARKDCLVALSDLGVDIAFLGTASMFKGVAVAARGILGSAYLARGARALGAKQVDPVDSVAVEVAKGDRAKRVAEFLLEMVKPGTPSAELGAKSAEVAQGLELIVEPDAGVETGGGGSIESHGEGPSGSEATKDPEGKGPDGGKDERVH